MNSPRTLQTLLKAEVAMGSSGTSQYIKSLCNLAGTKKSSLARQATQTAIATLNVSPLTRRRTRRQVTAAICAVRPGLGPSHPAIELGIRRTDGRHEQNGVDEQKLVASN